MKEQPMWRRVVPYILISLLVFALTMGSGPIVQVLVCAFAVGLGTWQVWMRRAAIWWTAAMFVAVGLYLASWHQPYWLVLFAAWVLVIVTVVAEGGRSLGQRRAARRG